jgi:two-component system, cell cycle sensor histidine kinase and response regulator CckA
MDTTHDGTLLLLDDDEPVRRALARVLRGAGYHVHECGTGEEAVRLVRQHAGPIDLLIADTVLPGMNGVEAAESIRRLRPGLPVVQLSGYASTNVIRSSNDSAYHFIGKPFRGDHLTRCVRTIIGKPVHTGAFGAAV